jgi:hypothetical protein
MKYLREQGERLAPWQAVWQCNDVRVTVTSRSPEEIEYDLGGMIWAAAASPWSAATSSSTAGRACRCDR